MSWISACPLTRRWPPRATITSGFPMKSALRGRRIILAWSKPCAIWATGSFGPSKETPIPSWSIRAPGHIWALPTTASAARRRATDDQRAIIKFVWFFVGNYLVRRLHPPFLLDKITSFVQVKAKLFFLVLGILGALWCPYSRPLF